MDIDYQQLLDECLIEFTKKVLSKIQKEGMGEKHHLYISFNTSNPGVVLSSKIKQLYPREITIILRYQFENLEIYDNKFSVKLSFNKIPETIEVPFDALTSIFDPSVKFSLQLDHFANYQAESIEKDVDSDKAHLVSISSFSSAKKRKISKKSKSKNISLDRENINHNLAGADVIKFDKFRKKPKK